MSTSERRLVENELVFRKYNESIKAGFDSINKMAVEEGEAEYKLDQDMPLHFYCECSDENCLRRIKLTPEEYNRIHAARNVFTIVCGHEVAKVEKVTARKPEFCVVTKYQVIQASSNVLNKTDIDNTTQKADS